jgi:hypothetical protein
MSLRFFHIFFIIVSSALAIFGGVWMILHQKSMAWAAASFAASAFLDGYLVWFIRKSRGPRS